MLTLTVLCAMRLRSAATEQEHANAECSDVLLSATVYAEAHPAWYLLPGRLTVPDLRYGQALYAFGHCGSARDIANRCSIWPCPLAMTAPAQLLWATARY